MASLELRHTIKVLHEEGLKPSEIVHRLKNHQVHRSLVYRTLKRIEETGTVEDRARSGRPRSARTKRMRECVRARVTRNPAQSQRKLSSKLGTSRSNIQRILREDLRLKPYKKRLVHGLTDVQKEKRNERSKTLIEVYAGKNLENIIFSDEKLFTVAEAHNPQNNRVYACSFEDISEQDRTVTRFASEKKIMVWAGISKKGKLPLIFVEPGVKINAEYYLESILKSVLKPHADILHEEGDWIFQQDSAPSHTAKICQDWCKENLPGFIDPSIWPPSSPDLNPLDYCIWGMLEEKVNSKRHSSIETLKASIQREWNDLSMEDVRESIDAWPRRLRAVRTKRGGRFE